MISAWKNVLFSLCKHLLRQEYQFPVCKFQLSRSERAGGESKITKYWSDEDSLFPFFQEFLFFVCHHQKIRERGSKKSERNYVMGAFVPMDVNLAEVFLQKFGGLYYSSKTIWFPSNLSRLGTESKEFFREFMRVGLYLISSWPLKGLISKRCVDSWVWNRVDEWFGISI